MRTAGAVLWAAVLAGCSHPEKPAPKVLQSTVPPVKITQFYTTKPVLGRGEKSLLCYGVENAKTVTLAPPRQELSAALSRCVEVAPAETTKYTLTAEGGDGRKATQDVTVNVGAPRPRIVEVKVSELQVLRGDPVSLCYKVVNDRDRENRPHPFSRRAEERGMCGGKSARDHHIRGDGHRERRRDRPAAGHGKGQVG